MYTVQVTANNGIESARSEPKRIVAALLEECVSIQIIPTTVSNFDYSMDSATQMSQSVYLNLTSVGIEHEKLLGYQIISESADTFEDRTWYLSYGINESNCIINSLCVVEGLLGFE